MVVIILTVTAIVFPLFQAALERARVARAIGDVRALQTDLLTFEAAGNGLPETLAVIGRATEEDPWGNPYRYLRFPPGSGSGPGPPPQGARKDRFLVPINSTFDLYSVGKDGGTVAALTAKASKDDVVRANDGGYIGLAEKY